MPSGKSKSIQNLKGIRRKNKNGQELAPRSLRKQKKFLKNCSKDQLEKLGIYEEKMEDSDED